MIEINLLIGKKATKGGMVGGVDLAWINIKMLAVAMAVFIIPDIIIFPIWDGEIQELNGRQAKANLEIKKLQSDLKQVRNIETQIKALKEQEERLARKLTIVKNIINQKRNPFDILHYLAQNTPKGLWFREMELKGQKLKIIGLAKNFKSIGTLLENIKNSIFFNNKSLRYTKPDSLMLRESEKRYETFQVDIDIVRFK